MPTLSFCHSDIMNNYLAEVKKEIRCAYYTTNFFICQPLFEYFFIFLKNFFLLPSFYIKKKAFSAGI